MFVFPGSLNGPGFLFLQLVLTEDAMRSVLASHFYSAISFPQIRANVDRKRSAEISEAN
ncbi:hypothetical protein NIASO_02735 [Niabella soli DSM 19437]|uniref:Uncharacterized protein n=1 Tax=Niabella soli DSM 19437 TaxID=929713 RepID=W0F6V1_9BACT|nr:hypothetical protein NIASO_02735 [Niabella soli DSM 19437]